MQTVIYKNRIYHTILVIYAVFINTLTHLFSSFEYIINESLSAAKAPF